MNLAIDQGNTFNKVALFEKHSLVEWHRLNEEEFQKFISNSVSQKKIDTCIFSSVRKEKEGLKILLNGIPTIELSHELKLPFSISYNTPETLGTDRMANVAGASFFYPEKNCLALDFGTCITYSLLIDGAFIGGAISPGITMRYKALHEFTGRLPLVSKSPDTTIIGRDTENSIRAGVQAACMKEVDAMIESYCSQMPDLVVTGCGGDLPFFAEALNSRIFAHPEMTLVGLNEILELNKHLV